MINPKTYDSVGQTLGIAATRLTEEVGRALKDVHAELILDPNKVNSCMRKYNAGITNALKKWNHRWRRWADDDLATAYLKGVDHADEEVRTLRLKDQPTEPISPVMPLAGRDYSLVKPTEVPKRIKKLFNQAPNHLTFYNVFRRAAHHNLEGVDLQIVRASQDLFRDAAVQAGDKTFRETDVFTRKRLSQKMLDDFAEKGIQSITYKNGRRVSIEAYAEMVGRTMSGHAAVQAALNRFQEYGYNLVRVSSHFRACPLCVPWEGKILYTGMPGEYTPSKRYAPSTKMTPQQMGQRVVELGAFEGVDCEAWNGKDYGTETMTALSNEMMGLNSQNFFAREGILGNPIENFALKSDAEMMGEISQLDTATKTLYWNEEYTLDKFPGTPSDFGGAPYVTGFNEKALQELRRRYGEAFFEDFYRLVQRARSAGEKGTDAILYAEDWERAMENVSALPPGGHELEMFRMFLGDHMFNPLDAPPPHRTDRYYFGYPGEDHQRRTFGYLFSAYIAWRGGRLEISKRDSIKFLLNEYGFLDFFSDGFQDPAHVWDKRIMTSGAVLDGIRAFPMDSATYKFSFAKIPGVSGVPIFQSKADAEDWIAKNTGVHTVSLTDHEGLNQRIAEEIKRFMDYFPTFEMFPQGSFHPSIVSPHPLFQPDPDGVLGFYNTQNHCLCLNESLWSHAGISKLADNYAAYLGGGAYNVAPGGSPISTIVHELTHALEFTKGLDSAQIMSKVLSDLSISHLDINANLTIYGSSNSHEFLAEGVAEALTVQNPRLLSLKILKEVQDAVREIDRAAGITTPIPAALPFQLPDDPRDVLTLTLRDLQDPFMGMADYGTWQDKGDGTVAGLTKKIIEFTINDVKDVYRFGGSLNGIKVLGDADMKKLDESAREVYVRGSPKDGVLYWNDKFVLGKMHHSGVSSAIEHGDSSRDSIERAALREYGRVMQGRIWNAAVDGNPEAQGIMKKWNQLAKKVSNKSWGRVSASAQSREGERESKDLEKALLRPDAFAESFVKYHTKDDRHHLHKDVESFFNDLVKPHPHRPALDDEIVRTFKGTVSTKDMSEEDLVGTVKDLFQMPKRDVLKKEDICAIVGAGENDDVRFHGGYPYAGFTRFTIRSKEDDTEIEGTLGLSGITISEVKSRGDEGVVAAKLLYRQVRNMEKRGLLPGKMIDTETMGSYESLSAGKDAGYYAWSRLGMDARLTDRQRHRALSAFPLLYDDEDIRISDILQLPGGAEWWKKNGHAFSGTFDTRPDSKSRFILEEFLKEKMLIPPEGVVQGGRLVEAVDPFPGRVADDEFIFEKTPKVEGVPDLEDPRDLRVWAKKNTGIRPVGHLGAEEMSKKVVEEIKRFQDAFPTFEMPPGGEFSKIPPPKSRKDEMAWVNKRTGSVHLNEDIWADGQDLDSVAEAYVRWGIRRFPKGTNPSSVITRELTKLLELDSTKGVDMEDVMKKSLRRSGVREKDVGRALCRDAEKSPSDFVANAVSEALTSISPSELANNTLDILQKEVEKKDKEKGVTETVPDKLQRLRDQRVAKVEGANAEKAKASDARFAELLSRGVERLDPDKIMKASSDQASSVKRDVQHLIARRLWDDEDFRNIAKKGEYAKNIARDHAERLLTKLKDSKVMDDLEYHRERQRLDRCLTTSAFEDRMKKWPEHERALRNMWEDVAGAKVADLIRSWALTSSNSPQATKLQWAAAEEFDMYSDSHAHIRWHSGVAQRDYTREAAGLRAFLRAQYEETQKFLKENGITEVYGYRGLGFKDAKAARDAGFEVMDFDFEYVGDFSLQPISSFSGNMDVASVFGADISQDGRTQIKVLLGTVIPAERILSTCRTGFGCLQECEFTVLGGEVDEAVIAVSDDYLASPLSLRRSLERGLRSAQKIDWSRGTEGVREDYLERKRRDEREWEND